MMLANLGRKRSGATRRIEKYSSAIAARPPIEPIASDTRPKSCVRNAIENRNPETTARKMRVGPCDLDLDVIGVLVIGLNVGTMAATSVPLAPELYEHHSCVNTSCCGTGLNQINEPVKIANRGPKHSPCLAD